MRVLTFGWEFPPHNSGGLGVACQGLTTALAHEGVDILFVLPKNIPTTEEPYPILFAETATVEQTEVETTLYPYIGVSEEARKQNKENGRAIKGGLIQQVEQYGDAGARIAKANDFDIIHAHDWLSYKAGIRAKEVSGKPLVVHVHATEFDRTAGQGANEQVWEIEKQGMEAADKVLTVSGYTRSIAVDKYGIEPDKINVVHNGIDTEESEKLSPVLTDLKQEGNSIVLFLGRKTIQKGPDYFLEAAARILSERDDIYFVMAGSGDMEDLLVRRAAEMGIADHVLFADFLRGDDVDRVYQSADVFVMPSVSEPFGITPLESLMNGTPAVISRQSGISEVLDHALVVDFWDTKEMANKIVAAAKYDSLNHELTKNGQSQIEEITWRKAALKCKRAYESVV